MPGPGIEQGAFGMFPHTIAKNETRGRSLKTPRPDCSGGECWTILPTHKEGSKCLEGG